MGMGEPGGLPSMGLHRVGHNEAPIHIHTTLCWGRAPGKPRGEALFRCARPAESRGAPPPPQDPSPLRGTLGSSLPSTPERSEGLRACYWEGPSELPERRSSSSAPRRASWLSSHGRGLGPRDALKKDSRGLCRGVQDSILDEGWCPFVSGFLAVGPEHSAQLHCSPSRPSACGLSHLTSVAISWTHQSCLWHPLSPAERGRGTNPFQHPEGRDGP